MYTRFCRALMGSAAPSQDDADTVAIHVIDGILDNKDVNGGSYADWDDAQHAVETYADEHFLERTVIDAEDVEWDEVKAAVAEALRTLVALEKAPKGIVLVNLAADRVWTQSETLEAAQAEVASIGHVKLEWEELQGRARYNVQPSGTRYAAYEIGLLDWGADDAERVADLGYRVGTYVARDVPDDLETAA